LNGTLRERVKVQRGWKSYDTSIAEGKRIHYNFVKPHMALEGKRIHYNFVKPHMALEGKTPAEKCGVRIKTKNKLLSLLEDSLR
jgi:hypothetical protein